MKVKDEGTRHLLLFVFSGILARASITYGVDSKQAGGGDSAIFKVFRYWVPPSPDYRDVWGLFSTRARLVANAKRESNSLFGDFFKEGETFKIYNDSAENLLKYLGKETVDYIYTDPPYGAHITYLDLSTMWHAWLGLEVPPEKRMREAIVGGELQFDEKHYLEVLQKSFEQMFHSLKDDAWLSLVFHHKQTNLWYSIRDMLRYIGFQYVNCVAQPLSKQTFHKVKNPLRVLGESLILNFQKSATRRIMEPMALPVANVIKNAAERTIVRGGGATTEEILRDVVPELFEAGLMIDVASKSMNDILAMLEQDFELGGDNLWHLKTGHRIGYFIPPRERIRYYVVSYLRKVGKADFDNIVTTILPLLVNGHQPTKDDIAAVLKEVAMSSDGVNWKLKDPSMQVVQTVLPLMVVYEPEDIPDMPAGTPHNEKIFRLALICRKAGLVPFIGKQERNDPLFSSLKPLTALSIKADPAQMRRIEQIDIIWATVDGKPVWAFEIEEHTTILSALERFVALLSVVPDMGINHQLTIVAPKSRRRKVQQELTTSSYIGHPQYMENKVSYLFYDGLQSAFDKFLRKRSISLNELHLFCNVPTTEQTEIQERTSFL
jgi:hypothetical protein